MAIIEKARPIAGTSLNYEIVGGTTAPISFKKENTIWINTETPIKEHYFSYIYPNVIKKHYNQVWSVENAYLSNTGAVVTNDNYWNITDYIDVHDVQSLRYEGVTFFENNRTNMCFYDSSQNLMSVTLMSASSTYVTIPEGAYYFRMCVRKNDKLDYKTLQIYTTKELFNPQVGDIWIQTDIDNASAEFNLIKQNELMAYPMYIWQWNGSTWIEKQVKLYQNGNIIDIKTNLLYLNGMHFDHITGGWNSIKGVSSGTLINSEDSLLVYNGDSESTGWITANKVDITNIDTLIVEGSAYYVSNRYNIVELAIGILSAVPSSLEWSQFTKYTIAGQGAANTWHNLKSVVDVSSYTGEYYIGLKFYSATEGKITKASYITK